MRKELLSVVILLLVALSGSAQHRFIGTPIQPEGERLTPEEREQLRSGFHHFHLFSLDVDAIVEHVHSTQEAALLDLSLQGAAEWRMLLERNELRAEGMSVQVASDHGIEEVAATDPHTYRGILLGGRGGTVRFSIRPGVLLGYVIQQDEEWFLEPLGHVLGDDLDDRFIAYRLQDVIHDAGVSCGVTMMQDLHVDEDQLLMDERNACRLANIAIAADGSMVSFLGSVTAVQNRVNDILNWVDAKYQEPSINIRYQLVSLFISSSTANDPWFTGSDASSLLNSFRTWGNGGGFGAGISYAVATLWTRRDITANGGSGVIGLAFVGVVCTSNRYNLCEHYTTAMTGPMLVHAHELGHNWSAEHTTTTGPWIMAPTAATNNTQWDNVTINSIVNHKNSRTCLGTNCLLAPTVDLAASATLSCDGVVAFTDLSTNEPTSWLWQFGDGNTSTLQNPVHTYTSSGTFTVQLTATNSVGQGVQVRQDLVTVNLLPPPVAEDVVLCNPGAAELTASGTGQLLWYAQATGGSPLATGPAFVTPSITTTGTWYVENSNVPQPLFGGAPNNTIGSGAFFTASDSWGLRFNVAEAATLVSVKVYANSAGNRTIQLLNSGGTVVQTRTVNIPSGESRVTLNMPLQTGQQFLLKVTGSTVGLFRNDGGVSYPYPVGSAVTITSSNASTNPANFYYYFYDWEVQLPGCASARTPVTASVIVCTGVDGHSPNGTFVVRPNPSDGVFMLDWSAMQGQRPAQVEVLNTLGQRVLDVPTTHTDRLELMLGGAQGIYLLRALGSNGEPLLERRLVLQR